MTIMAEHVYEAGLQLDSAERVAVAHRLLQSLDAETAVDQADIDAAWSDEISARIDEILNGTVELVDWQDTLDKARAIIDAKHA